MGIVYRIDQERGLVVVLWDGRVTADEFFAHARRLLADAEWLPVKADISRTSVPQSSMHRSMTPC